MKEIRTAELRTENPAGSSELVLIGRPIVFDVPTTIGGALGSYTEIIKRGALDGADLSDVRLLYANDTSKVPLARTPKTMQLSVTPAGLELKASLPNTTDGQSVYTAVQRGDLSGMSFAFKVPVAGDAFDAKTNTRTINKIEKVYEISVVTFPAYPQTSVEARDAMTAAKERAGQIALAQEKINQIMKRSV